MCTCVSSGQTAEVDVQLNVLCLIHHGSTIVYLWLRNCKALHLHTINVRFFIELIYPIVNFILKARQ